MCWGGGGGGGGKGGEETNFISISKVIGTWVIHRKYAYSIKSLSERYSKIKGSKSLDDISGSTHNHPDFVLCGALAFL